MPQVSSAAAAAQSTQRVRICHFGCSSSPREAWFYTHCRSSRKQSRLRQLSGTLVARAAGYLEHAASVSRGGNRMYAATAVCLRWLLLWSQFFMFTAGLATPAGLAESIVLCRSFRCYKLVDKRRPRQLQHNVNRSFGCLFGSSYCRACFYDNFVALASSPCCVYILALFSLLLIT